MNNNLPTVFIVDDEPEWCESIKWLLSSINIATEIYYDGASYLNSYDPLRRGCLLLDIRMPGMSGLQLQEKLNEWASQIPIIILSGHADIPLAVRAMKAGAFDFLTKPFNEQQLLEQINNAIEQDKLRSTIPNRQNNIKNYASLTTRERQIMEYVIAGKLNKQIAAELDISIKTVELHRSHLMQKLQARTLADLFKIHNIISKI